MHLPCGVSAWLRTGEVRVRSQQQEKVPHSGHALGQHTHVPATGGACSNLIPGGDQKQISVNNLAPAGYMHVLSAVVPLNACRSCTGVYQTILGC